VGDLIQLRITNYWELGILLRDARREYKIEQLTAGIIGRQFSFYLVLALFYDVGLDRAEIPGLFPTQTYGGRPADARISG
jgi:hypothetical protein